MTKAGRPTNTSSAIRNRSGIYGLVCPIDGRVRYVGRSNNIGKRFTSHKRSKSSLPVARWIRKLKKQGVCPEIFVIEYSDNPQDIEEKWISEYKRRGQADLNLHSGGKGTPISGCGRLEECWSVDGHPDPYNLLVRALWRFQNFPNGKKIIREWSDAWKSTKSEWERINMCMHMFNAIQKIGSKETQIKAEEWAIMAAPQINSKYPGRARLQYNDGVEVTP